MERQIAQVTLKRGRSCWLWIIEHCPLCGKRHQHGGGPLDGDPRKCLGGRAAHCFVDRGSYWLVEALEGGNRG